MSIGQRIAQKRKEWGLSQEALGDQLGISRQSIYKWESDAALPEIEKLIALSRLFGVSAGWILGVEDASPPKGDVAPEEQDSELTEAQLKMVEEIVDRYLAAQPKPISPKRRRLFKIAIAIGALCLVAVLYNLSGKLDRLNSQYNNLQNSVSNVSSTVNSQINGISNRVEEILKSQNSLTAEYDTEITTADLAHNTITFSMKAVPKTYSEGMTAVFLADCGDGPAEFPADLAPGQAFTGEAAVELTDSITLSVVFIGADGTRQTQLLDTYEGLFSTSLPGLDIQTFLHTEDVVDNAVNLTSEYVITREDDAKSFQGSPSAQIFDVKLGVFRNQKLLGWAEPCEQPSNYHGSYEGRQFYRLPDLIIENLTESDKLYIAALVTDSYGRQFMASDIPYVVKFDTDFDSPYLTYPSDGRYDSNPDNWDFS